MQYKHRNTLERLSAVEKERPVHDEMIPAGALKYAHLR
jgi:hypothetical protein